MAVMIINSVIPRIIGFFSLALALACLFSSRAEEIGQLSGSLQLSVGEANTTIYDPFYTIAGIAISQDPVYTGTTASVNGGTNVITLSTEIDAEGNTLPSFGVNHLASGTVRAVAAVSGGAITGITIVSPGSNFASAPTVTIDDPSSGIDAAVGTAVLDGTEVDRIDFTGGASGYTSAPAVSVDSGPHLIRITSGPNEGRFFLISSNTDTTVTVAASSLGTGETLTSPSAFNSTGNDSIEIIRATTLADAFGATAAEVELETGPKSTSADWVFLWSDSSKIYLPYFFKDDSVRNSPGWYKRTDRRFRRPMNDQILYPDQAFIIARRTANEINPEFEGIMPITDTRLRLPVADNHFLTTNPFGGDVFLSELISTHNIGATDSKFYPGVDDEAGDLVYILSSSGTWYKYFHNLTNVTVSSQATCSAIRLSGGGVSGAYLAYPANPSSLGAADPTTIIGVTNPAPGSGNMTVTTGSAHGLLAGDVLTIKGVKGYKTNDTNTKFIQKGTAGAELEMTNGNRNPSISRVIESAANGTWEVLTVPNSAEFTIGKSGNAEFLLGSTLTAYWRTGTGGAGYSASSTAKVYFIGNGASNAFATVTTTGGGKVGSQTITTSPSSGLRNSGSGYGTAIPQAVFSSGGWRESTAPFGADAGNEVIPAGAGILIYRHASRSGKLTFLKASNPAKLTKD
jgi:hypothetical protein